MGLLFVVCSHGFVFFCLQVFGRQNKKDDGRDYLSTHFSDIQYNAEKQKFSRRGIPDSDDEEDEMLGPRRHGKKKRRDLERLLMKADRDKISEGSCIESDLYRCMMVEVFDLLFLCYSGDHLLRETRKLLLHQE